MPDIAEARRSLIINLERDDVDCLVIGGGPAGLAAATYLGRFRLSSLVYDGGESRAARIPCTRNQPGFPEGIAGADLLGRMRQQVSRHGVRLFEALVTGLTREDGRFRACTAGHDVLARTVILATGVRNRRPEMNPSLHDEALALGRLRYCPICDGYEVTDKRVAVIGTGGHAAAEAEFIRSYSACVTLVSVDGPHRLDRQTRERLSEKGIVILDGPAAHFALDGDGILFWIGDAWLKADTIYVALGSHICSELGAAVGAEQTREGCIKVDAHQRTSVPGLYAAGDVVPGLDQISVAIGQAALAATTVRNDLCREGLLLR